MNIVFYYLGGLAIGGLFAGLAALAQKGMEKEREGGLPEKEEGAGYLLDGYGPPEKEEGEGVLAALLLAFRSLQKQGAAGYGPWLSTCIRRSQAGDYVPASVAATAIRFTLDELSGKRFDTGALTTVLESLEKEEGDPIDMNV